MAQDRVSEEAEALDMLVLFANPAGGAPVPMEYKVLDFRAKGVQPLIHGDHFLTFFTVCDGEKARMSINYDSIMSYAITGDSLFNEL